MNPSPRPLPLTFYAGETVSVARNLIGCLLWRRIGRKVLCTRIVETEAYLGANDPASHARGGHRSPRNESMYLSAGHAYVYFTYGMHYCLNVVTAEEGVGEALLIRAAEPVLGIATMRSRRIKARADRDLTNGPAKLCQAIGVDRSLDGASLRGQELFVTKRDRAIADDEIQVSARIGIDYAGEAVSWPLRFYLSESDYVSRRR